MCTWGCCHRAFSQSFIQRGCLLCCCHGSLAWRKYTLTHTWPSSSPDHTVVNHYGLEESTPTCTPTAQCLRFEGWCHQNHCSSTKTFTSEKTTASGIATALLWLARVNHLFNGQVDVLISSFSLEWANLIRPEVRLKYLVCCFWSECRWSEPVFLLSL